VNVQIPICRGDEFSALLEDGLSQKELSLTTQEPEPQMSQPLHLPTFGESKMAVTIEIRDDKGVVLHYSGLLTANQIINAKRTLVTEQHHGLRYLIVDVTAAVEIHISAAEIWAIVDENKRLALIAEPGMPVAVAAPQDIGFGMARMWEVHPHETGWRIAVVRSRAEADSWIQQNLKHIA
jgi:hypothetical protein